MANPKNVWPIFLSKRKRLAYEKEKETATVDAQRMAKYKKWQEEYRQFEEEWHLPDLVPKNQKPISLFDGCVKAVNQNVCSKNDINHLPLPLVIRNHIASLY